MNKSQEFLETIKRGNVSEVKQILDEMDIDQDILYQALYFATKNRMLEIFDLLIVNGANINWKAEYSETILHESVSDDDVDAVKLLIENGADVNAGADYGEETPICFAVSCEAEKSARILLENGANTDYNNGSSPLHLLSQIGNVNIAKMMLSHGADINAKDSRGCTPLHEAVHWCGTMKEIDISYVEFLLKNGAEVNAGTEKNNYTPLDFAHACRNSKIQDLLISYGGKRSKKSLNEPENSE